MLQFFTLTDKMVNAFSAKLNCVVDAYIKIYIVAICLPFFTIIVLSNLAFNISGVSLRNYHVKRVYDVQRLIKQMNNEMQYMTATATTQRLESH